MCHTDAPPCPRTVRPLSWDERDLLGRIEQEEARRRAYKDAEALLREWVAWAEDDGLPDRAHELWERSKAFLRQLDR